MTLLVVLMLGFGTVLITSAIETDPATGKSVSVLQTISDVWNNRVDFSQPAESNSNAGGDQSGGGPNHGPFPGFILQPGSGNGGGGGTPPNPNGGPALGTAAGDAYRQAVIRAWLQSQQ